MSHQQFTGLRIVAVSKRYGAVQALDSVSLEFVPGEVHAVLGENGAGKSTLVNVIAGLTAPDSGTVVLDGVDLSLADPAAARRVGIGVVHQHFTLVPNFTVAENIALFRLPQLASRLNVKALAQPALDKAEELGWKVDPDARIAGLPVGAQQRVEILKCLCDDQAVLVFDEPTAPLGPDEVEDLLQILRRLAEGGRVVVLIAHKLREVLAVADRISVLRRGKVVATNLAAADMSTESLAELMVGEMPPEIRHQPVAPSPDSLEVRDLAVTGDRGEKAVRRVTFSARRGEIFGIGGVDGNGQVELAEALAGVRRYKGAVLLDRQKPERVAYIPADRHSDGLALGMSVRENLLVGRLRSWPRQSKITPWAQGLMGQYEVRASGLDQRVGDLSGGNQQKLIVARSLDSDPEVVIALNPTRGLDVRAERFVHDQLRLAAERGAVVVLISADVDELYAVADRVKFLSAGRLSEGEGASAVVGGAP